VYAQCVVCLAAVCLATLNLARNGIRNIGLEGAIRLAPK